MNLKFTFIVVILITRILLLINKLTLEKLLKTIIFL
jgi:hypothetical protein